MSFRETYVLAWYFLNEGGIYSVWPATVEGIDRNLMAYKFNKWEKPLGLFIGRKEPHQSLAFSVAWDPTTIVTINYVRLN